MSQVIPANSLEFHLQLNQNDTDWVRFVESKMHVFGMIQSLLILHLQLPPVKILVVMSFGSVEGKKKVV